MLILRLLGLVLLLVLIFSFGSSALPAAETITLSTTTSTQDSGLLEALLPPFEAVNKAKVKVIAVGTGQALEIARRGDADVVMVHAQELEEAFIKEGEGTARRPFMYNDFIVVGPPADPAGISGLHPAVLAFYAIASKKILFISRGDKSGTNVKELAIWKRAGLKPEGNWYLEAGSGMAATLQMASEKRAYTLTDRATFLAWKEKLDLKLMVEKDPLLRNIYSVIVVDPKKHPEAKVALAGRFADYLFSPGAKKIIADFGKEKYRQPLFYLLPEPKPNGK